MTNEFSKGQVTIPLEDYNHMRDDIIRLSNDCVSYRKEIERLRALYAELRLPSPDTIDWDTINFELSDLSMSLFAGPRRKQRISFEYTPNMYNPSDKPVY